jgi:hypothetical protein
MALASLLSINSPMVESVVSLAAAKALMDETLKAAVITAARTVLRFMEYSPSLKDRPEQSDGAEGPNPTSRKLDCKAQNIYLSNDWILVQ